MPAYRNQPPRRIAGIVVAPLVLAGCGPTPAADDVVWAANVGGPAYLAVDGTSYTAEESVAGGTIGRLDEVVGSQDTFLYLTYREGDVEVAHPVASGSYDLTLHFAEPADAERGDRVFDVFVEGRRVIDDLDVMFARDQKIRSALTMTVPNVSIADGELNIGFEASAGAPLLSAIVVRAGEQGGGAPRRLVWSDEFDYTGPPNPDLWNIEEWAPGVVNAEDQAYTARSKNVRVEEGFLALEAHREDYRDARYTSARIQSSEKGDILQGRVEVRARVPAGTGTWSAIWMLPNDPFAYATTCADIENWQGNPNCDAWPNSGEIDILEHVGYATGMVHATVHNKAYYYGKLQQRRGWILVDDVADAFHVYALEWSPDRIEIFVDDTLYFTYMNEGTGWDTWPYDRPFHLIMNLAIGGNWGRAGGGIDDTIFPVKLEVDYVRVYESDAGH